MCKKVCKICGDEKSCDDFHKMKKGLNGVRTTCKLCRKIEKEEYQSRDYVIEKNKKYYQDNKETIRERTNKHRHTLNGQYHQYKKSAKKRGIEFNLLELDCLPYFNGLCYYCNDKFTGVGIDRVDNSIGYIKTNLVPCCYRCNIMKHTSSKIEFINQMKKILNNLETKFSPIVD